VSNRRQKCMKTEISLSLQSRGPSILRNSRAKKKN